MTQPTDGIHHSRILGRTERILEHLDKATRQFNGENNPDGSKISIEDAIRSVRSAYELTKDLRDFLTPDPTDSL